MRLIVPIFVNCLLVLLIYLAEKYTKFKNLPYIAKQIVIGILFGCVSAFASSFGVEFLGTNVNVRDAAPLSAGLIFGPPAGIISGVIGGLYRWFWVYWNNGNGAYTQLACSLATIIAGFMAAALRKFRLENKKPTITYGMWIAVSCEVVHMILIFITNMDNPSYAFEFVKGATIPMIIGNSLAVGVSILIVYLLSDEKPFKRKKSEKIANTFQRGLLICIVVAYLATTSFTFILQNGIVNNETEDMFAIAIGDVRADIKGKSDAKLYDIAKQVKKVYEADTSVELKSIADEYGIEEINVVNSIGEIEKSTDKNNLNYNMNDADQSREFVEVLKTEEYFVQEYGLRGKDGQVMRKYAAIRLSDGGFIQVGYDADQFHEMLNEFVIDVTKNRHVGTGGFVAVLDEKLCLVIDNTYLGQHISSIGIDPPEAMLNKQNYTELEYADVKDGKTDASERYLYAFEFVEGYCIIAAMPEEEATFMRDASIYTSNFMQVLIFAALFIFIFVLIKRVILDNLDKINSTLARITAGDLDTSVDVRSSEEFSCLSDDINSTVATLKKYIAEAAARIDKELEYAKQIQLSALPTNFPKGEDYNIYAQMIAAKEVGGDFYDFYKINDKTVAVLVADVSGKGIPAAMFMMTAKTIIKDLAESGMAVNDIFTKANEKLCENNESGMFVTAWMGILDLDTGTIQFANAGHNPPLLKRAGGDFEFLRTRAGFVLAGMEGVRYRIGEITLSHGDRLFLYTDGVTEATDKDNKLYGEERLLNFMNCNSDLDATELLPALKANLDEFVGEAPQFDDITMLAFDYKPNKGSECMTSKTFPAKTEALSDVLGFVDQMLFGFDCPMKIQMAICVAIEELFVNIAHYAYDDGEGDMTLSIGYDEDKRIVSFSMIDSGKPFDPLKKPDPDITLSAEEREIGGLGIFITKKTMDSISYSYEDGKNILKMSKKI